MPPEEAKSVALNSAQPADRVRQRGSRFLIISPWMRPKVVTCQYPCEMLESGTVLISVWRQQCVPLSPVWTPISKILVAGVGCTMP
jgi:hypothetical protein